MCRYTYGPDPVRRSSSSPGSSSPEFQFAGGPVRRDSSSREVQFAGFPFCRSPSSLGFQFAGGPVRQVSFSPDFMLPEDSRGQLGRLGGKPAALARLCWLAVPAQLARMEALLFAPDVFAPACSPLPLRTQPSSPPPSSPPTSSPPPSSPLTCSTPPRRSQTSSPPPSSRPPLRPHLFAPALFAPGISSKGVGIMVRGWGQGLGIWVRV